MQHMRPMLTKDGDVVTLVWSFNAIAMPLEQVGPKDLKSTQENTNKISVSYLSS